MKAIIIMGSDKDMEFSRKISEFIEKFSVQADLRIASAHKTPLKALAILNENKGEDIVFITVAGRSNALSGFVDANTAAPVIACPPLSKDKFDTDIFSSISMPSGVAPMTVLGPENAGLAAVKILALNNKGLKEKISSLHDENISKIEKADKESANG